MIKTHSYEQLGHADHGWLNARHHFSFANYHNPERMAFGALRVINDDIIKAGNQIRHSIKHQAYLLVSRGMLKLDGHTLKQGDGAEIRGLDSMSLVAEKDADVLVIDVPERARH